MQGAIIEKQKRTNASSERKAVQLEAATDRQQKPPPLMNWTEANRSAVVSQSKRKRPGNKARTPKEKPQRQPGRE